MNQIAPKSINFNELVKSSNTTLSLNVKNQLVKRLIHILQKSNNVGM
jgi:hypothetical protein